MSDSTVPKDSLGNDVVAGKSNTSDDQFKKSLLSSKPVHADRRPAHQVVGADHGTTTDLNDKLMKDNPPDSNLANAPKQGPKPY